MENLKVSEAYKKAYNQADMICAHMPHLLKGMNISENKSNEYTQGFKDRIKQYEGQQKNSKSFSLEKLKAKYKDEIDNSSPNKGKSKDLDKE